MNEQFIDGIETIKRDYEIKSSKTSNNIIRARIANLCKDKLLELDYEQIQVLMVPITIRSTGNLAPIESACILADIYELNLYLALLENNFQCESTEIEKRNKSYRPKIIFDPSNTEFVFELEIIDQTLKILKGGESGNSEMAKSRKRKRLAPNFEYQRKGIGKTAGERIALLRN